MIYGLLVENKDEEDRAEIDALLRGDPSPREVAEREANRLRLIAFAYEEGEVAGGGE